MQKFLATKTLSQRLKHLRNEVVLAVVLTLLAILFSFSAINDYSNAKTNPRAQSDGSNPSKTDAAQPTPN